MQEATTLMLYSDTKRFFDALEIEDPDKRARALAPNPLDLFIGELLLYGMKNNPSAVMRISQIYETMVIPYTSEEVRHQIYTMFQQMVMERKRTSPNTLYPFLIHDPSRRIVATAALDLVALCPVEANDPLSATRPLVQMIVTHSMVNRGAAFGGLLFFGDPRVCKLLWDIRDTLDNEELIEMSKCQTPFIQAAAVEFLIDWLDDMQKRNDEDRFGPIAAGLMNQITACRLEQVFTGERPIPSWSVDSDTYAPPSITLDAFRKQIGPRLHALEQRESDPKIMPYVLEAWGV